jgi:hypothetical protein
MNVTFTIEELLADEEFVSTTTLTAEELVAESSKEAFYQIISSLK